MPSPLGAPPGTANGALVLREWHHRDLVLQFSGRGPLVIENKLFALPDESQLDRYATEQLPGLSGAPDLVLLSLMNPGWHGGTYGKGVRQWRFRGYRDLVALLEPCVAPVTALDNYAGQTLQRWLDLIRLLDKLATTLGEPSPDEPLALPAVDRATLRPVRLDGPIQKMRCQWVAAEIRRRLPPAADTVTVTAGLTNALGLVEGFTRGRSPAYGWQLQGNQWRLAIDYMHEPLKGATPAHRERRKAAARQEFDWFNLEPVRAETGSRVPERPAAADYFLRYDPSFVYRYQPVPGLTVGQAIELGVQYSIVAASRIARSAAAEA